VLTITLRLSPDGEVENGLVGVYVTTYCESTVLAISDAKLYMVSIGVYEISD
jgi:hypothetical protein